MKGSDRSFGIGPQAELTEQGEQYLEQEDLEDEEMYEDLSHRELVEKVHGVEDRIKSLEQKLEVFREQVKQKLDTT